jgi:hypothetical protein
MVVKPFGMGLVEVFYMHLYPHASFGFHHLFETIGSFGSQFHDVEEAFRAVEGDAIGNDGGLIEIAQDTPFVSCLSNADGLGGRIPLDAVILGIVVPNHFV